MIQWLKGFFIAFILTYLLASVLITLGNLSAVQGLGLDVSIGVGISAIAHDMTGMISSYLALIAVGFLIALPVAALLTKLMPNHRAVLYALAGFTAVVAIHVIMKSVFGLWVFAPTRSLIGLIGQGLAGAVGGYVFHLVTTKPRNLVSS
ncbi:MAG: hypothetical protein AAGI44_09240 [Pseudomonadota bacterium]